MEKFLGNILYSLSAAIISFYPLAIYLGVFFILGGTRFILKKFSGRYRGFEERYPLIWEIPMISAVSVLVIILAVALLAAGSIGRI